MCGWPGDSRPPPPALHLLHSLLLLLGPLPDETRRDLPKRHQGQVQSPQGVLLAKAAVKSGDPTGAPAHPHDGHPPSHCPSEPPASAHHLGGRRSAADDRQEAAGRVRDDRAEPSSGAAAYCHHREAAKGASSDRKSAETRTEERSGPHLTRATHHHGRTRGGGRGWVWGGASAHDDGGAGAKILHSSAACRACPLLTSSLLYHRPTLTETSVRESMRNSPS